MSKETTEAIRQRLLADDEVQYVIRMRAYEIYQQRGGCPGNPADDWFQAESEVLAFYFEKEVQLVQPALADVTAVSTEAAAEVKPKRRAAAKPSTPRKTQTTTEGAKKTVTKRATTPKSGDAKPRTRKPKPTAEPKAE